MSGAAAGGEGPLPQLDLELYKAVGNIAHSWASLEYMVNECIWEAAKVDQQLGACITAQIVSLRPRLEALLLLLRARGVSKKLWDDVNDFTTSEIRAPLELRNRAVHDPLGVHMDGKAVQLQITAQGKLVFERREVNLAKFMADLHVIENCLTKFRGLRNRMASELATLPYTEQRLFPTIIRATDGRRIPDLSKPGS